MKRLYVQAEYVCPFCGAKDSQYFNAHFDTHFGDSEYRVNHQSSSHIVYCDSETKKGCGRRFVVDLSIRTATLTKEIKDRE